MKRGLRNLGLLLVIWQMMPMASACTAHPVSISASVVTADLIVVGRITGFDPVPATQGKRSYRVYSVSVAEVLGGDPSVGSLVPVAVDALVSSCSPQIKEGVDYLLLLVRGEPPLAPTETWRISSGQAGIFTISESKERPGEMRVTPQHVRPLAPVESLGFYRNLIGEIRASVDVEDRPQG